MKMYDVTGAVFEGMTVYKNKPEKQPKIKPVTNGYVTESRIELDVHTGTHVDAPLHMVTDGETFETIALDKLVGNCKVLDLTNVEDRITRGDLELFDIEPNDFLLFKTKNSWDEAFSFEFVYLAKDGAEYLASMGVRGVGTDALGIERSQEGHPTHKALFAGQVIIIEGLRLKDVPQGEYFLVAAPLKLIGTDAAPARVLLFDGVTISK
ncbi:cyclase family protein [Brevibacillus choshinensis]|uniref:cyclase family protein n=1 Tax=Brevibacillus choshinensis TaxID=54911 RepID=UPI002E1EB1D6|nr:cyclase family protein [Brevibacillus choshinensis]MED4752034.1 cyclase family protein [Brevibacillus choshinensis]MED4784465.1 cyclase family protein [Brevibacillus choshinensis]